MEDQELVMFWLAGDHKDKLIEDFLNDFARDLKNDQK